MDDASKKQIEFFEKIKSSVKHKANLASKIAKLLDLSTDAVYRRMRGETMLDFRQTLKLCHQYSIKIDNAISENPNSLTFKYM
jgi:DNA-binding XRE family transcriptional regulator